MVAGTLASRSFGGSFPMSGSEVPVPFMQKTTCSKSVTAAPKENRCLCVGGGLLAARAGVMRALRLRVWVLSGW